MLVRKYGINKLRKGIVVKAGPLKFFIRKCKNGSGYNVGVKAPFFLKISYFELEENDDVKAV